MSPSNPRVPIHSMFSTVLSKTIPAKPLFIAAAIILAMVQPASAVIVTWQGGSGILWSTAANWSGGTPAGNDIQFGAAGAGATPSNEVGANIAVNSLWYADEPPAYHTTKIDAGATLKIQGSINYTTSNTYGGLSGNISLMSGTSKSGGGTLVTQNVITGDGTLDISTATGGNTGGDIVVRQCSDGGSSSTNRAILDLSGLAVFNANVDQLLVGYSGANTTTYPTDQRNAGTLYLAKSNTITLNNTSTAVTGKAFYIGYATGNASSQTSYVYLGQTNVINVDNVVIGGRKGLGTMALNPIFSSGSLTMRGVSASRVASIILGDNSNNGSSSTTAVGVLDLTGVNADIRATSIILGRTSTTAGGTYTSGATGTLTIDAGTVDTTGMTVALQSASSNAPATGTVNVNGTGNLVIGTDGLLLAQFPGTTGSSTGTLNINGGTVTLGADITSGGGNSIINISSGLLNMQGHNIGTSGAPLRTVSVSGGSISNLANLAVTNFAVAGDFSLPSGTLTIGNNGKIDMRDSAAHTLAVSTLTLPASSSLYYELSNNTSSGNDLMNVGTLNLSGTTAVSVFPLSSGFAAGNYRLINYTTKGGAGTFTFTTTTRAQATVIDNGTGQINLNVTDAGQAHNLTWNGNSGYWDLNASANWTSSFGADKYFDLDTVNFGSAGTFPATITLYNSTGLSGFYPGSVTVNSTGDYTFAASGANDKISGVTGLTKSGAGALTINLANDYAGATNLNEGKIILGNNAALGSSSAPLIIASGATLDLNTYQLSAKPVTVQGAGVGGNGAIVNNNTSTRPAGTQYDVSNVTMTGDTTFGGTSTDVGTGLPGDQYMGRWSMRATSGSATLSTGGNPYNLTKTGNNQVMLVNTNVDPALANVYVNMGVLGLEGTTTLGDPTKTVTVDGTAGGPGRYGAILQFRNVSTPLNKKVVLQNGGQLYALVSGSDSDNTVVGPVAIADSGGTLNAGGSRSDYTANPSARMTISGVISGSAAATLTKTGPGTVTLANANTFSGSVIANDGTLVVNGSLPVGVTLQTGSTPNVYTTLAGTGTVGGTTQDSFNTRISPAGSGAVGTLNLGNLSLNGGGQVYSDLSTNPASGNDLLSVNGNLSISTGSPTALYINPIGGSLTNGTYHLIYYSGSQLGGNASNFTVTGVPTDSRQTYVPTDAPHYINLYVSGGPASLVWKGDSTAWDVKISPNWLNGASPDVFYTNDTVTFNDSGQNTLSVDISTSVAPASITVDNSTKGYKFNGYGKITGSTGLTKSGTGTLTIANLAANDYSGTTTINAGTLQVGDGANSGSRLGTGPVVNNARLAFNAPLGDDYAISSIISGSGTIEQKGANTVTFSGANTYTGPTLITSGTIKAGNAAALGTVDSGTTIASGATLDVNNLSLGAEPITVSGQGVNNAGAIVNTNTTTTATPQNALRLVTLTGDTTFGGTASGAGTTPGAANSGRWDIRSTSTVAATLSTGGNAYNVTKVGNNQVTLVGVAVDPALANINVNQGVFAVETTSTLGNPNKTVTVASGAILQMYNLGTPLNKKIQLNGGTVYALNNSSTTDNTIIGDIALSDSGGILNAGGSRADVTSSAATLAATRMTINGVVSGSLTSTLTKSGPGTVVLNATNTFSGMTNLTDGTLVVNGSLPGGVVLSTSPTSGIMTTLGGTGTVGGTITDNYNVRFSPGENNVVGTLNVNNLMLYGGGQLYADLSNSPAGSNDLLNVGGALYTYGTTSVYLNPTAGYLQGDTSYHLIHYNSITGWSPFMMSVTGLATDGRQTYSFTATNLSGPGYVDLVVTGSGANLKWKGNAGNDWDVKTTSNWLNGASPDVFWNGDFVTFDDSATSTSVNVSTSVMPAAITVNAGRDYTFTGAGAIVSGSLTKQGTGTLTLSMTGTNTYSGQTKVENGTLLLVSPVSNNSPVLVTGGTLKVGATGALGTAAYGTTINGGTLDINGINITSEPITVQGAGVGGSGAIVNNSSIYQQTALNQITLTGDTTIGGNSISGTGNDGRWDVRGTGASLSTGGHSYNLTKTGNILISLVSVNVDPALGNVYINQGALRLEDSTTFGDSSKTVTIASGATFQLLTLATPIGKSIILNGGTIHAVSGNPITQDVITGPVTVNADSFVSASINSTTAELGKLTFANSVSGPGGLTKIGTGTVYFTGTPSYGGATNITLGTLQINSGGAVALHAITGTNAGTLGVDNLTSLTADSIMVGTLNVGPGSTVTINPLPGGPLGAAPPSAVPEPATWAMLALAAIGLGVYWRRR